MFALFLLLGYLCTTAAGAEAPTAMAVANASLDDLFAGYDQWSTRHPGVFPRGKTTRLDVPSIDLYAPSGVSVYHGTDSAKNAAFLDALAKGIGQTRTNEFRPTLQEAIEMFSELKAKEAALLADKRYTIFALTYPHWDRCKAQNDAIEKLREHATQLGIRIIEVRLHP